MTKSLRVAVSAILDLQAHEKLHKLWVAEINEGKKTSKNQILNRIIMEYEQKEKQQNALKEK